MRFRPLLAVLLLLTARLTWSASWDVAPAISVGETYTDNVTLAPKDLAVSDWITQVTPEISITGRGANATFNLKYAPELTYYAESKSGNGVYQKGYADLNAELAGQTLFIDAGANVDQYNVFLTGPITAGNIYLTGNTDTVATAYVSPYLVHDFSSHAQAEARYTASIWNSDEQPQFNSTANRIDLGLASGPASRDLTWNLDYRKELIDYDDPLQADLDSDVALAKARQLITSTIGVLGRVGYEYYKYDDFRPESNGWGWAVGVDWTPSRRTTLSALAGERFYGNYYKFDFQHRARLLVFSANYNQEVTANRQGFFLPSTTSTESYLTGLYSGSIDDPTEVQKQVDAVISEFNIPPSLNSPVNYYSNQLFLQKSGQVSIAMQGIRNVIIANIFVLNRDALVGNVLLPGTFNEENQTRQTGTSLSWNWRMSAKTSLNSYIAYTVNRFPGTGRVDDLPGASVGVSKQFQPRLLGTLRYRWQALNSTDAGLDYKENSIAATLRLEF